MPRQSDRSWSAKRTHMTRRIVAAWNAASADDLAAGLAWYDRAQDAAAILSPVNPTRGAGVIAALSPRCKWAQNLAWAALVIEAADSGAIQPPQVHTTAMRKVAWSIATWQAYPWDALKGPKTNAFYRNITGNTDAVTVDVWAAAIAEGAIRFRIHRGYPCSGIPDGSPAPTGRRYDAIAGAYRDAARVVGVTPREVQAAVWVAARGSAL